MKAWGATLAFSTAFAGALAGCWWLGTSGPAWAVRGAAYLIGGTGVGLVIYIAGYVRGVRDGDEENRHLQERLAGLRVEVAAHRAARDLGVDMWADFESTDRGAS